MANIPVTNVAKLSSEIRDKPYRSVFPSALPDHWIQPIARDLREVEQTMAGHIDSSSSMAAPLLLALHIKAGRLRERGIDAPASFSVHGIARWMQIYQFVVERELVTRLTGIPSGRDEEVLVAALDMEIDGASRVLGT